MSCVLFVSLIVTAKLKWQRNTANDCKLAVNICSVQSNSARLDKLTVLVSLWIERQSIDFKNSFSSRFAYFIKSKSIFFWGICFSIGIRNWCSTGWATFSLSEIPIIHQNLTFHDFVGVNFSRQIWKDVTKKDVTTCQAWTIYSITEIAKWRELWTLIVK